jgi:hypothetical protein
MRDRNQTKHTMKNYISISGEEDAGTASIIVDGSPITQHLPIQDVFNLARQKGIQTDILWRGDCGKFEENMTTF